MAEFNYENTDSLKAISKLIMPASFYRDKTYVEIQKKITKTIKECKITYITMSGSIGKNMKSYLEEKGFQVEYIYGGYGGGGGSGFGYTKIYW